jgi:hypothetical protein
MKLETVKLLKSSNVYAARNNEAAEKKVCMKLRYHPATENAQVLKVVHKRLEAKEIRKYEARSEEAAEMRTQQQCILSGGVHLRHRFKDNPLPFLRPKYTTTTRGVHHRRSGVLACKKLSLNLTRHSNRN